MRSRPPATAPSRVGNRWGLVGLPGMRVGPMASVSGAPDVIFEISSPSTTLKDRREKMELFERSGVAEYFIVVPDAEFIEKYMLKDGKYNGRVGIYAADDTFRIDAIGLELTAKSLFAF